MSDPINEIYGQEEKKKVKFCGSKINKIYNNDEKDKSDDSSSDNDKDIPIYLIDPLNSSPYGIDLVHMFAVMDAAYSKTGKDHFW